MSLTGVSYAYSPRCVHISNSVPVLQMLGTCTEYQGKGIGKACIQWGCEWADKQDMEVYIDASMMGAPVYIKHGALPRADIPVPDKLDKYGTCHITLHKTC